MPPIFKNVGVSIEDIDPYMKNICQNLGEFKTPQWLLIGSYFGEQIMVASPLFQWYYVHGLVIENIIAFVCYEPVPCFSKFTKEVTATHRKADFDKAGTAAGNTAKLIGKLNIFFNNCD